MSFLTGIHDPGAEHLNPSWVVQSFDVRETPYWHYEREGVSGIARLNWSHTGDGTIPEKSLWVDFASLCTSFVAQSRGVSHFIIGNEPNHPVEKVPHPPEFYADCYRLVYGTIKEVALDVSLLPAAIAPWALHQGLDWIEYFKRVLARIDDHVDALALHTYSRGYTPEAVVSEARMNVPYQKYHNGFRSYIDFLEAVPEELREVPVHITETNGNEPWPNRNNGYVQALYSEIDRWNSLPESQKIHSLSLFRWASFDQQWEFQTKDLVHQDFREAVAKGYSVAGTKLHLPIVSSGSAKPEPEQWDTRLTERGVAVETPPLSPGQAYWKVVKGEWLDEEQSQGKHHIFLDVWDPSGQRVYGVPLVVTWPNGAAEVKINKPQSESYGADFGMSPSRNEFSVKPVTDIPAERVTGIGMGSLTDPNNPDSFNAATHTSTFLVWQLARAVGEVAPEPVPVPEPIPEAPTLPPSGIIDPLLLLAFLQVESGNTPFYNGLLVIRFEVHRFKTFLGNDILFDRYFRFVPRNYSEQYWRPNEGAEWKNAHGSMQERHQLLGFARSLNDTAALNSTGMGLGQVMGHNAKRVGFASPQKMFGIFSDKKYGANAQLVAFMNYIMSDPRLVDALRRRDLFTAVQLYNGIGQEAYYVKLLTSALNELQSITR